MSLNARRYMSVVKFKNPTKSLNARIYPTNESRSLNLCNDLINRCVHTKLQNLKYFNFLFTGKA